jgi:poly(A) polymerase
MPKRELPSLNDQAWLQEPRLQEVLHVLNTKGETRVAGGAVRNALLGVAVADVDVATVLLPEDVMTVAKAAGFGVHPTGLEHGTITVTCKKAAFEVTTLRRDIETDGRHAVVSFTTDWAEDAARRDFTINAMYCDASGKIYDYTRGYADIQKRKVRFVGDASERIAEDYLRILRFFRFHAWYGKNAPDKDGLQACAKSKSGVKKLSVERVRQELFKLLAAPEAIKTLQLMATNGVLRIILPHTEQWRVLGRLPVDALLRLFVLARDRKNLKDRLRLSNEYAVRLAAMVAAPHLSPALSTGERRRILYQLGVDGWRDAVHISLAQSKAKLNDPGWLALLDLAQTWEPPRLPVKGTDLIGVGLHPGPKMGQVLSALEDWWVANDFKPTRQDLMARVNRYTDE